jgi:CheY-like chemotaxis protein
MFNQVDLQNSAASLPQFQGIQNLIDTAVSGEQALALATEGLQRIKRHTYCLVFLDLTMRKKDGYRVAEELRRLYKGHQQPRIIAWSCNADDSAINKAWRYDFDEYVHKPISSIVLE